MVATYAQTMPPGRSASATASRHSQGASMSRMTRSAALAGRRQRLGEVADGEPPGRVARPRGAEELGRRCARATSANSSRRSYDDTRPCGPDRAQQRAGQRAGADAGLDDVRAGEDVGHRDDLGGVLGVDHRRAARHRDHELAEQRPEDEVLAARRRGDREALLAADQLVVVEVAAVGEEALARLEADVVPPALLVGQPHPLPRPQRAAVDAGPGLGRDVGSAASGGTRRRARRTCARTLGIGPAGRSARRVPERPVDVGGRQHAVDRCRRPRRGGTPRPACG